MSRPLRKTPFIEDKATEPEPESAVLFPTLTAMMPVIPDKSDPKKLGLPKLHRISRWLSVPLEYWNRSTDAVRREARRWKRDLSDWSGVRLRVDYFLADRRRELALFWYGTRMLIDLVNIAFFARLTRSGIDDMRQLAIQTRRTPPHAFALFVGIVTTLITLQYAVSFGLPWPMTQAFVLRSLFLAWQGFRLCVYLGSLIVEEPSPGLSPPYVERRQREDITEKEIRHWRGAWEDEER